MVKLIGMTQALVTALQGIPEILPFLANQDPNMIVGYVDASPAPLSRDRAVQNIPNGAILVTYEETEFIRGEQMPMWAHRFQLYLRCVPGQSALDMINTVMDGVPTGQNLRWRYAQLLDYIYPQNVIGIARQADAQDTDYFVILAELMETGDFPAS